MNVVIVGEGERAAWVERTLGRMRPLAGVVSQGTTHLVRGGLDPGGLLAVAQEPIDIVVTVDAVCLAQGAAGAREVAWRDRVRQDAERAIYIRELVKRTGCPALKLVGNDSLGWHGELARLLSLPDVAVVEAETLPALEVHPVVESSLVASYLDPLWAVTNGMSPLVLTWPRECFLDGDQPNEPLPPMMELAGRARILAYGPYLPLPSGRWRATACLGFSPDIEKLPFIFEALTPPGITRGFFEAEAGGFFTLELDFQVIDPFARIEMRLETQDSALEGQAALIEVRLEAID